VKGNRDGGPEDVKSCSICGEPGLRHEGVVKDGKGGRQYCQECVRVIGAGLGKARMEEAEGGAR
jgi:hypothetical protein